jgi:hypothetical protein
MCSICLTSLVFETTLKCGHSYCNTCVTKWANLRNDNKVSCPCCRSISNYYKSNIFRLPPESDIILTAENIMRIGKVHPRRSLGECANSDVLVVTKDKFLWAGKRPIFEENTVTLEEVIVIDHIHNQFYCAHPPTRTILIDGNENIYSS